MLQNPQNESTFGYQAKQFGVLQESHWLILLMIVIIWFQSIDEKRNDSQTLILP